MSQKENKFQSKSKKFGGKGGGRDGGKSKGGFGPRKPGGDRKFGKKFEGDRQERGGYKGSRDGARPARRDGDEGGYKGKRSYGERGPRKEFGDRPPRKEFGDRKPRRDGDEGGYKGKRSFGDRPPRRDFGDRPFSRRDGEEGGYKGKRSFGDRPPRKDFGDRKPRRDGDEGGYKGKRSFGDRPPRKDFGDRKPRRDFGDRPFSRRDDDEGGYKPKRSFGDRPPRKEFGDRKPRRDFGDKPRYRDFDDRKPKRDFAPRKQSAFNDMGDDGDNEGFEAFEASAETKQKLKSDRAGFGAPSSAFLFGHHAVRAALQNPRRLVQRLLATESGFENIREAYDAAQAAGLKRPEPVFVEKEDIERLVPRDAVHQDVLLDSQPAEETFLADVINGADDNARILVLDQVTDPHNVGAILRSASAFGVVAVVAQKLHAPEITGTLAKSASGAAEYVPLVREVNLSRALEQLKEAGFFCIGLDERGKETIAQAAPKGRVALVLGAEGAGLRRLVAENCDALVKLPTQGPIASLNVSNAAAVALYELVRAG
jgi:23S rRNA (guanosine2251-2'-O)-methyltransferase